MAPIANDGAATTASIREAPNGVTSDPSFAPIVPTTSMNTEPRPAKAPGTPKNCYGGEKEKVGIIPGVICEVTFAAPCMGSRPCRHCSVGAVAVTGFCLACTHRDKDGRTGR